MLKGCACGTNCDRFFALCLCRSSTLFFFFFFFVSWLSYDAYARGDETGNDYAIGTSFSFPSFISRSIRCFLRPIFRHIQKSNVKSNEPWQRLTSPSSKVSRQEVVGIIVVGFGGYISSTLCIYSMIVLTPSMHIPNQARCKIIAFPVDATSILVYSACCTVLQKGSPTINIRTPK